MVDIITNVLISVTMSGALYIVNIEKLKLSHLNRNVFSFRRKVVELGRPTANCSTPVERRQRKPGLRVAIDERAGRREPSWPTSGGDDGRRRRPLGRCGMPSARYGRAVPFKQQYVRTQRRKRICSGTRNQTTWQRNSMMYLECLAENTSQTAALRTDQH